MAVKIKANGTRGLNFTATLNINEARKNAQELKKTLAELGISAANGFDTKPLTGYQQAQLALKKTLAESQAETEKLRQKAAEYRAEVEKGKISQQENRTELDRLRAAEQALKNDLQSGKISLQNHRIELERNRVAQQALNQTLAQGRIDQQNHRTELARLTLERRREVEAQRAARQAQVAASGSYREAQQRLKQLGDQIRSVAGGFQSTSPLMRARIKEYNELNDALKRFDASMGNHQRNVGNYRGAIQSTAQDLLGFAAAYLSIGNALTYVFNQTLAFQRLKTPLTFILGSEGAADAKLAELKKFADQIGVEYFSIANSYKSFIAAAKASNFDLMQSEKIFRSVAKAGAVLGLSNDTLQGTFLALQQMISKGTVQSEELRGQLSERLPGAFAMAAKAMGVTEQELGKLLQTGQVTASEMLPKLALELDKAYGDKAGESISGLNAELNRLYSTLQSLAGEGSFLSKNLFEPIVRGAKEALNVFYQLTRGDSFLDFMTDITTFTGAETRSRRNLYDARDLARSNQSQLKASKELDYSKKNLKELRNSYQENEMAIVKTAKAIDEFTKKSKEGPSFTRKETEAHILTLKKQAEAYRTEHLKIGKAIDQSKKTQVSANKEIADSELTSISAIQKRITELKKQAGSAIAGSDVSTRIAELQERLKKPGATPKHDVELNQQRSLQEKIDELTKKGLNTQLDANQQEIESVKTKYAKLREEAKRFNNDPDNKKLGLKVNTSGLTQAESRENDTVIDKQAATKLKVTLDEQKRLYEEFEQFKLTFGEAKAKERYDKLINTDRTYLQYLSDQQAKILGYDDKAKGGDLGNGGITTQQAKVLEDANKEALSAAQKRTDALLKEFMGYAEKRKVLIQNYERDFADLENNPSAQAERTKRYDKDLKELDDANAKKLDSYQTLFEGIESLSQKQALKVLQAGRAQLAKDIKSGAIVDPAEIAKIKKYFDDVEVTIREGSGQALMDLARQVDEIAAGVGGIDAAFGKVLGTLGNVLGQVGNIKKGFKDLQLAQSKGSVTGQLTAGLGIFGAGLSIFQSVVSLFSKQEQRETQASYARDLQNKQTEALNKALERQVALLNDVYGTDRIRDYSAAIKQAQENQAKYANELVGKYTLTGDQQLDEFITKLNNGEKIDPTFAGLVAKAKKASSFLPSDINTLQRLLDEGKLDANTATIVQNLIKAKETAEQLVNNLRAETVGTTLEQIADDFISTLTDGTQDFGKSFEATIQKSILNGFKGEVIRKQLQAFYTQFAELSEGGLTAQEIETLRQSYITASEKAKADLEALSKATGIDLTGKDANNSNSIKGALTSASQDSINILSGYTAGVRLQLVKVEAATIALGGGKSLGDLYLTAKSGLDQLVMIEANTRRTADNTQPLAEVRDILKSMKGPGNYNPLLSDSGQTGP
ncbi:MAG: hypothetical protein EOO20_03950 [Chryseobacterium sp.]|nr:MAG: hypothetical protein EOO20_03950 [Chryseobacterium sp.]